MYTDENFAIKRKRVFEPNIIVPLNNNISTMKSPNSETINKSNSLLILKRAQNLVLQFTVQQIEAEEDANLSRPYRTNLFQLH